MASALFQKRMTVLLVVGGAIVAATFLVGLVFGIGTWESWWISNFLHLLGGFYAVFFVRELLNSVKTRHQILLPRWTELTILVGGALILGVFWEWFEFALDRYRVLVAGKPGFITYADNMGYLVIDFMVAVVAVAYLWKKKIK